LLQTVVLFFGIMPGSQRSYWGLAMLAVLGNVLLLVTLAVFRKGECKPGDEPPRSAHERVRRLVRVICLVRFVGLNTRRAKQLRPMCFMFIFITNRFV
jgi:putative copper export protein